MIRNNYFNTWIFMIEHIKIICALFFCPQCMRRKQRTTHSLRLINVNNFLHCRGNMNHHHQKTIEPNHRQSIPINYPWLLSIWYSAKDSCKSSIKQGEPFRKIKKMKLNSLVHPNGRLESLTMSRSTMNFKSSSERKKNHNKKSQSHQWN